MLFGFPLSKPQKECAWLKREFGWFIEKILHKIICFMLVLEIIIQKNKMKKIQKF